MSHNKNKARCNSLHVEKLNFKAKVGCAKDDAAVAALPDTWKPKHGGPILANYLKEQEQNHKKVLKYIIDEAAFINTNVDTKVRALAETLLAQINQNQLEIDCIIKYNSTGKDFILKDERKDAFRRIKQIFNQRFQYLEAFKYEATVLERERADNLRFLLRDKFKQLIAVSFLPPKDLLYDFDERMYEINQQLLSNSRAYIELEVHLRFQADESIVRAKSNLNQICLGVSLGLTARVRSAASWFRGEKYSQIATTSPIERKSESSEPSIGKILVSVEEFNDCISHLVQAYKTAVLKVFTDFSGNLNMLQTNLNRIHCFLNKDLRKYETLDLLKIFKRNLRRLSLSIQKNQTPEDLFKIANTDILSMQKSLWALGECFKDTYQILYDAGHLWDAHMLRLALAQKLTMAAVEDLLTSNDMIQFANEMSFNIALEQLLCSYDVDKVQQQYETVVTMLDRIAEFYDQHNKAELNRLEEFLNLPSHMAKTLLSEFDCFLEKYRRTSLYISENESSEPGMTLPKSTRTNTLHSPLSRAILQTELQEIALKNWKNGFLESFESNVSLVPLELQHQAQLWVDERASALHMRYSLKSLSHIVRLERVKAARERRLAQLHYHENRLNSHLDAVYELVDSLLEESSQFLALDSPSLYPVCQWIDRILSGLNTLLAQDPLDPDMKRLKMNSYAIRLSKHRSLYEESLDTSINRFKKQLEYRIQEARISNVRFMSHIKLFNEGGRYAVQEASKTSNALLKASVALELCLTRSVDALHHRRGQLLVMADQRMLPLQKIVENNIKTASKNVKDKKKQVLKRK